MSERKGTKALELWCKRLIKDCPEAQIENMTTSWRNGIAFCALVHHFKPNLIPLSTLNPNDIYYNNQLAFSVAEKELGIPALLDPEDMVENEIPDRLSILTYLSQFYQRLGHTVSPKNIENESKDDTVSHTSTPISNVSRNFVKADLDKCTSCGQSVYLAQRLIVSHKLYHRRCFRCYKCSVQLSPGSYSEINDSNICCEACKIESNSTLDNNNDSLMGMLEFSENLRTNPVLETENTLDEKEDKNNKWRQSRPLSVLEKIGLFENNKTDNKVEEKLNNLSVRDTTDEHTVTIPADLKSPDLSSNLKLEKVSSSLLTPKEKEPNISITGPEIKPYIVENAEISDNIYKTDVNKFMFLQTQLSDSNLSKNDSDLAPNISSSLDSLNVYKSDLVNRESKNEEETKPKDVIINNNDLTNTDNIAKNNEEKITDEESKPNLVVNESKNDVVTKQEDVILINSDIKKTDLTKNYTDEIKLTNVQETLVNENVTISIPPRLKKSKKKEAKLAETPKAYPDHLNPFSDDDDEEDEVKNVVPPLRVSTNPFGSSDEEEDEIAQIQPSPAKRVIAANPFWSDGEEPTSDEDETCQSSGMYSKSSMTTSTPNIATITRRKKARAPLPPTIAISEVIHNTSCADVASITSGSSFNSEHKTSSKLTPRSHKKKLAPTPPDSLSIHSNEPHSLDKSATLSLNSESGVSRRKGPAPGLPLPARREVRARLPPDQLQAQLELLDTQQLGLERQGVLIEQMIRDKCEGDEASSVPQDEVEELVIQLCELVNEKNDLFRKHTELMYIRRQQRLEQEQADIEHEIRVIQSKPVVNRTDSDKVREEQLVSRLVETVGRRDLLVQQLEDERRRERLEDQAIATSIATRRAQRNSDSNTSSMKSFEETPTPKKNKMKEKVKKQLKKAKHTLHIKKKDDKEEKEIKEKKIEKEHKTKWF